LLRKRISPNRFEKFHRAFEKHPFWSLMFPAMLPPPTPFKLFALAAAVSEMRFSHYLLAIFAGRFVRFLVLSVLTLIFGPQFVHISGTLFREHLSWVLAAVAVGLVIWLLVIRLRIKKRTAGVTVVFGITRDHVETVALGCPAEQRSAVSCTVKPCRAALDLDSRRRLSPRGLWFYAAAG
jgi:hypothetical protein